MIKRIGIIGGGQLGRMMIFEAKKMGFIVNVLDPTPNSPAGQVADRQIVASYTDKNALEELANISDVLTVEVEIIDEHILHTVLHDLIKKGTPVHPLPQTLSIIQDKLIQKQFLKKHHLPIAQFVDVVTKKDITAAARRFGFPLLLKVRTGGYDGRGNFLIKKVADIEKGLQKFEGQKVYVEKFIPFVKELAVMVARDIKGKVVCYPVVETIHKNNICHIVSSPAHIDPRAKKRVEQIGKRVVSHFKDAGVFGIEMFLTKDSQVLINEIAPRVHNSGHYTIEACTTSQFEQHIRAISGLPLGVTTMSAPAAVMINILGERNAQADAVGIENALKLPQTTVHIYGKLETKQERKMGHITVIGESVVTSLRKAKKARKYITI